MCRKSGSLCIVCTMAIAAGILAGAVLPSGFLVFVLCILLIAIGVMVLL